jgi:hypothetical protein
MIATRLMVGVSLFGLYIIAFVSVQDGIIPANGMVYEYIRSVAFSDVRYS